MSDDFDIYFEVVGWKDWNGDEHAGPPLDSDLDNVMGTFTRYYDPGGGEHYEWIYIEPEVDSRGRWHGFDSWDDWYDLINDITVDHLLA